MIHMRPWVKLIFEPYHSPFMRPDDVEACPTPTCRSMHKMKRFKELKKVVDSTFLPIMSIEPGALLEFADEMGQLVPPKSKYGHRPLLHCFIDDAQSTPLFRDRVRTTRKRSNGDWTDFSRKLERWQASTILTS